MATNIYTVGGTVQAGEGLYIERAADAELLELCRNREFAYILHARQMGKSSIVAHTAERLREQGIRPVVIDLTSIGTELNADQWYLGLLVEIANHLDLRTDPLTWWRERKHLGVTQRLSAFIQEVLLHEVAEPIVIFVDEIDTTLILGFTDDFYAAIRALYNARAQQPDLRRIGVVLIGVATPGDLIKDPQRTPFNIGRQVTLTDFTPGEAQPFTKGMHLPPQQAKAVLARVLHWTGGHPYLTQRLCAMVGERHDEPWNAAAVDELVRETLLGERSKQDNNLQFVRDMLTRRASDPTAVLTTYRAIWRGRAVRDEERSLVKSHLKLSGVVRRDGDLLGNRNRIYYAAFDGQWIRENLPNDWTRLALRVTLAALAVVATIAVLLGAFLIGSNSRVNEIESQRNTAVASQQQMQTAIADKDTAYAEKDKAFRDGQRRQLSAEVEALALRSESVGKTAGDPEVGLLLAIEAAQQIAMGKADDPNHSIEPALVQALQSTGANIGFVGALQNTKHTTQEIISAAWSPDGTRFLTASGKTINVWDDRSGKLIATLPADSARNIVDASWSLDSSHILIVYSDTVQSWDASLEHKTPIPIPGGQARIADAFWSPDATRILTLSYGGIARVWDANSGAQLHALQTQDIIDAAAWSPDGKYVATVNATSLSGSESLCIWDSNSGQLVMGTISPIEINPENLCLPRSGQLVTQDEEASRGEVHEMSKRFLPAYSGVFWSHNSKQVAYLNNGDGVIIDIASEKVVRSISARLLDINLLDIKAVTWSSDDTHIFVVLEDGTIQIQKTQSDQLVNEIKGNINTATGNTAELVHADWSPDGTRILVGAKDGTVYVLWNGTLADLIDVARSHLSKPDGIHERTLTPEERQQYGVDALEATPVIGP
jgi:WD40 repeat protein